MYKNVKAEMKSQNLTLNDISSKMGITVSTLSDKLNGLTPITWKEAKEIKEILAVDIPIEELFKEFS